MSTKTVRRILCLLAMLVLTAMLAFGAFADSARFDPEDPQPPEGTESTEPSLEIAFKNLSYQDSTYLLFAVDYENVPSPSQIRLICWTAWDGNAFLKDSLADDPGTFSCTFRGLETINGVQHAVFRSKGLAPRMIADVFYCRAYVTIDGTDYYSEVLKYSGLQYIKDLSERDDVTEADRNIVTTLRAYANAAQIRFNYNTDNLAGDPHGFISVDGAALPDGFTYGLYKNGTALTITAEVPAGDSLARWVDGAGNNLGSENPLQLTVNGDRHIRAILASSPDSCDHVYGDLIPAADATCTEAGCVAHYHCSVCGRDFDANHEYIENAVLPALGHDWIDVAAQPAACIPGHTAYRYCSRCGEQEGYTELPANADHTYVEETVAPSGEVRGYINHVCSVCGDSYKTDYDYSLYSGVNFSTEGKFAIPYNFDADTYTIEASVLLPTTQTARAGVIMGNYDGTQVGFNLEVYSNGRPRLYIKVPDGNKTKNYDYIFTTDIRSDDAVKNLAITIERGEAKLYVDGVLAETKTLGNFDIPHMGRTMVLGGDNRAGNSQGFKGTIYSASVYRDLRTPDELVSDLVIADANDPNCICSYNLVDGSELTGGTVLENVQDNAQVTTIEELAYHASHGTHNIEVMNDITVDRTIYAIGDVTIFANSNVSLIRDPDFFGDMIVVGENASGRNLILDNITCELDLGKAGATGTLTVDGNKANVNGDVFGTLVYINFSGTVNVHDGAVLTNNRKVGNSRTLGMEQYFGNMIGGAAVINVNGTLNIDGGLISNNEVNDTDPGSGDTTAENYLESCYGGAIFSYSNVVMSGGTISGNSAYYGGAIANFQECDLTGGVLDGNFSSHAGGAIYMLNLDGRMLVIGDENGANSNPSALIFRNNYSTGSSGGAIYAGANCYTIIYGGVTFQGNEARNGSGGAVSVGGVCDIRNAVFTGNTARYNGGAVNLSTPTDNVRTTALTGCTFTNNSAANGGAVAMTGTNTTITNCDMSENTASSNGGAIYVNRMTGDVGATLAISGGELSENTAGGEAGALFADVNCTVGVTGTAIEDNESVSNGGAISLHGAALTLRNLTLSGNSANSTTPTEGDPVPGNAGAVYASYRSVTDNTDPQNPVTTRVDSSVTMQNCTVSNNHADGLGGAAMGISGNTGATLFTITGSSFTGNTANNHGGAINLSASGATVNTTSFTSNSTAKNGGAIYCSGGASLSGSGDTFTTNGSTNSQYGGGAIYSTGSTVNLTGATFTGNTATTNGGAIAAYSSSTVTLTNVTATGNTAGNVGGFGMAYNSTLTLTTSGSSRNTLGSLSDDTLGNTAGAGGVIYADVDATINVSNADIGYNSTTGSGGALYFNTASGSISGSTVSHNTSGSAGGDSYGGAMMVGYGSNVTITNSAFSDNTASSWAGAIYIRHKNASGETPAVASTVTASGTSFTGNSAKIGGAIHVREYCTFNATNCTFTSNEANANGVSDAGTGGAIHMSAGASVSLTGSTLTTNSSSASGGAIHVGGSGATLTLSGTTLRQNTTSGTGGAIHLHTGATLTSSNNSLFDGNTSVGIGGAIYFNSANGTLTDTDFTSNATTGNSAWYGGAIYTNGTSALSVTRCDFTGNSNPAGNGGAICARGTGSLAIEDSSFTNNTTKANGGAVQVFGTVTATIEDTDFTGNSCTNTSSGKGGALCVGNAANDGSFVTVTGGTFSGNNAAGGGAVYVFGSDRLDVDGATFSENTGGATGGGAIYAEASATVNITDATFDQNSTTGSGGAMYFKESVAGTITDTDYTDNTAGYGGAMILFGANVTMTRGEVSGNTATGGNGTVYLRQGGSNETGTLTVNGTAFENNVAPSGAAIYVNANAVLTTTNATFTGNGNATDTNDGGAIFVYTGGAIDLTGGSFASNTAKSSGGAIYLNGTATAELDGVGFTGNAGGLYGGAIYMNGTTQATVTDCTFTQNTLTANRGGAICVRGSGPVLTIDGTAFNQNSAKEGGAISAFETVTLTITDSTFTGNTSSTYAGAVMAGRNDPASAVTLTLDGCTFTSNTAATNCGAVYLYGTGSLTATDTDFIGNTATSGTGGAIYSYLDGSSVNVSLTNCTLRGNTASGNGGAIYHSAGSKMTWTGVTVKDNATTGGRGDAVYVTNGSGKTTTFEINSATVDQPSRACIDIGNSSAYVTVHQSGVTDVNHSPVDFTKIITGTLTHVSYV